MTETSVDRDLVLLHWVMAALFLLAIASIVSRGWLPAGHALRPALRAAHIAIGQGIFALALVRAVVRWRRPPPAPRAAARWQARAAQGAHALLYVVMFAQPLTGVLFLQAGDKTVTLLGLAWPNLMPSDPAVHFALKDAHVWIGNAFYALIALHVAAALWHHHVRRDDTLRRMLRWRTPDRAPVPPAPGVRPVHAPLRADAGGSRAAWLRRASHRASQAPLHRAARDAARARRDAPVDVE